MGSQLFRRDGRAISKATLILGSAWPNWRRTGPGRRPISANSWAGWPKSMAPRRDVAVAMRTIDEAVGDLLYDQARALQHEIEDLTPV